MKPKTICLIGLFFFVLSYVMFSNSAAFEYFKKPVDFAHWFNLIGACLLLSFNHVFPKNRLNAVASVITTLGVVAHIGLCTIDFIMWSYGDNDAAKAALSEHLSNTPSILFPFVFVGPSLLFVGLATHAGNFIKTNTVSALMVIIGAPLVGFSFFVLKNGILMFLSCLVFVTGLSFLLFKNETKSIL